MQDLTPEDRAHLKALTIRADNREPSSKPAVRSPYQFDLGRIIHSSAFRRLQAKTQVMGTGEGDFHRTRLTHSIEVGQIARGILWEFAAKREYNSLQELLPSSELMEAISYAHDLGHPPFGHGGETALHIAMKHCGGFEGNAQNLRILTRLEPIYRNEGIRPTRRLLLGVLKYPAPYSQLVNQNQTKPPKCYYDSEDDVVKGVLSCFSKEDRQRFQSTENGKTLYKSLDCSIMEQADDIAYGVHDFEDAVARGLIEKSQFKELFRTHFPKSNEKISSRFTLQEIPDLVFANEFDRKLVISTLVGYLIRSISLEKQNIFESSLLDWQAQMKPIARDILAFFKSKIVFDLVIDAPRLRMLEWKGQKIITDLFSAFQCEPQKLLPPSALSEESLATMASSRPTPAQTAAVNREICDFISSMTDRQAETYHRRLFEPGYGSSTDQL